MPIALSGSLVLSGSITVSGSIVSTGGITISGSIASSSYAATSSFVVSSQTDTTQDARLLSNEQKTGSFATTGSNFFIGTQVVTGSVFISSNLVVQGSSSLQNITASAVSVGTNRIILNTATPILQFGGISVQDSGSTMGRSGSLLWNSINDHWINVNPSGSDEGYNSAMVINGPKNTGSLGSEVGLTTNYIPVSQGEDHITDSIIFQSGSTNIGIGTTSPSSPLTLYKASSPDFDIVNSTATHRITGDGGNLLIRADYGNTVANSTIQFSVDGTEVLRLVSSGTATFSNTITATGAVRSVNTGVDATFADTFVGVYASNNNEQNAIQTSVSSVAENSGFRFQASNGGGSTGRTNVVDFRRDRALFYTNVGIGTTSPAGLLQLQTTTPTLYITSISDNTAIREQAVYFGASNTITAGYIKYQSWSLDNYMTFGTNGSERMRINLDGFIGIGNTPKTFTGTTARALQLGTSWIGTFAASSTFGVLIGNNFYWNGDWKRTISGTTSLIQFDGNNINFISADTGAADSIFTPTSRMYINSLGNIGIGVTPTQNIPLVFADVGGDKILFNNNPNHYKIGLGSAVAGGDYMMRITAGSGSAGEIGFYNTSLRMLLTNNGTFYINTTTNPLSNATPQLGIVAGSGTDAINIKHTQNGNNTLNIWQTGTTTHSALAFYKGDSQNIQGTISVTTSAVTYNSTSDYRLKENVVPIQNGLNRLMQLKPSKFNWIETGEEAEGFIAHELQEIFPDAVTGEKDAVYSSTGNIKPQSVDYGRITPLLVKALQELKAELNTANQKIAALESRQ
jgi:hypothetical protein